MIVAMSATAGKTPLVAAGEAGHEVRLDEPEHEAAVGLDVAARLRDREPVLGGARRQRAGLVRVVVQHTIALQHLRTHHGPQLVRRVRPVRAGAVDHDDVRRRHVSRLGENPGQQAIGQQRPGDVGDHDRHPLVHGDALAQRLSPDWGAHRLPVGRRLVGQALDEDGLDHPHPRRWELDVDAAVPVLQANLHRLPLDRPLQPGPVPCHPRTDPSPVRPDPPPRAGGRWYTGVPHRATRSGLPRRVADADEPRADAFEVATAVSDRRAGLPSTALPP
jgi:hypothetical protein